MEEDTSVGSEKIKDKKLSGMKQTLLIAGIVVTSSLVILTLVVVIFIPDKPQSTQVTAETPQPTPIPFDNPSGLATNKSEFIQNEKSLSGSVQKITFNADSDNGVIMLRAAILDVNTEEDYIEGSNRKFIEKEFSIRFDSDTTFKNKLVDDLVQGDMVKIDTSESIYLSSDLVASRVVFFDEQAEAKKQIIGDSKVLLGTVMSKTDTEVIVSAEVIDMEKLDTLDLSGSYSVPYISKELRVVIDDKTEIVDEAENPLGSFSVGDVVYVTVGQDIYKSEPLTAEKIMVEEAIDENELLLGF